MIVTEKALVMRGRPGGGLEKEMVHEEVRDLAMVKCLEYCGRLLLLQLLSEFRRVSIGLIF